ncbi:MAG: glycerol-3-phosphate 1-O-acyltransferase PlsY [Mariprofundaceae bacterium]|nr:glycerol-3-phosphate 1-O-acyltransferase PlsY [Mariprofundaceae bacterium]
MVIMDIAFVVAAYLLGALPFGLIFSKAFTQVDIREHGSGNIGATNALRVAGPKVGILTLLADVAKGALPLYLALQHTPSEMLISLIAIAVFMGHMFPVYLRFQGGKGVATMLGILLVWQPWVALGAVLVWAAVLFFSRYVSAASIAAASVLPLLSWYFNGSLLVIGVHAFFGVTVVLRHCKNIERLLAGVESKIGGKT